MQKESFLFLPRLWNIRRTAVGSTDDTFGLISPSIDEIIWLIMKAEVNGMLVNY